MGRWLIVSGAAVALAAVQWPSLLLVGARAAAWFALRLLQIVVLLVGSGSFWWVLRSYQLAREQELLDQALLRYNYYSRYRHRSSSSAKSGASSAGTAPASSASSYHRHHHHHLADARSSLVNGESMVDAGFQLRVLKRLPIVAHLRTSWGLPPELCDEIAAFSRLVVRDYVSYWFQPISPANDEFPHDVKFLLADLLGAIASRLMEIDSSQALTMIAKCIELFRLHLGWFREAYAQLAEEYPEVFDPNEVDDANLVKRQEYVMAYVQQSQFVHPACVAPTKSTDPVSPSTTKKEAPAAAESAEALYLRHLSTQLLVQLKPQFGQQYDTNIFVSIATNLLREITAFKILKPLTEYALPRYANELVVACLGTFIDDREIAGVGMQSPTSPPPSGARPSLDKLRMTGSFLYKASKRSGEQAEAAFQALVDAVSSAATTATGAAEGIFDGDEWSDAAAFTFGSSVLSALAPSSGGSTGDRKTITSMFSLDERINLPKAPRLMAPRNFMSSTPASSQKTGDSGARTSMHLDDLKNVKANIGSSLNSSIGKVKKRFRTFSGHPNEHGLSASQPPHSSSSISGALSSNAAARMIRKPGQLLQKAWKRNESTAGSATSPNAASGIGDSFDDMLTPPSTPDGETRHRSNARTTDEPFDDDDDDDEEEMEEEEDEEEEVVAVDEKGAAALASNSFTSHSSASDQRDSDVSINTPTAAKIASVQDRVVLLLDKTVASYVKMFNERPEMRSSARARELYELLSALEDVLMLGYRTRASSHAVDSHNANEESERVSESTLMMVTEDDLLQSPAHRLRLSSSCFLESDPGADDFYYWNYLAQDRPDAPLLNEHWRFIATRCPPCCDSDSFVSTRGIQWLLVALEKGLLWEFFTGLRLHPDVTRQHYDEFAILSDAKRLESVLKSLRQLNALKMSLEIPAVLGRKSEMDQQFGVSPTSSRHHARGASNSVVRVLESVWETERYVPIQGWVKAQDKRIKELPSSEWVWEGDWALERRPSDIASPGDSSDSDRGGEIGGNDKQKSSGGSWEYAKTFEDHFHDKEKKFDSVRRRRWIRARRQLPSVLAMVMSSSSVSPLSPSLSSGAVSPSNNAPSGDHAGPRTGSGSLNGWSKARRLKNRLDVFARDKADKLERATKLKTGRPMAKRRSFSFDKDCPTSPITTSALAALNVDLDSFCPGSSNGSGPTSAAMDSGTTSSKLTTNATPLLRRSSSGRTQPTKGTMSTTDARGSLGSAVGLSREFSSRMSSGYEEDMEDDDLCFRCLKSLTSKAGSAGICQSCHQRVCAACHDFFAFAAFPPPLESTKKARVCGNCYDRLVNKYKLRIDAHVGKYLIKDKEKDRELPDLFGMGGASGDAASSSGSNASPAVSPSNSATATANSNAKFEITVRVRDESAYAWTTVKTFHDFEVLEKNLFEKLKKQEKKHGAGCRQCHWKGVDYMELLAVEPSLRNLPVAALSYEKRLYVLEEFLQSLLACDTLCQSVVVQKFLLLTNANAGGGGGGAGGTNTNASQQRAGWDGGDVTAFNSAGATESGAPSSTSSSTGGGGSAATGSGSAATTGALLMENGKWKKGRWIAPDANSKETKMRVLQKMEVSLFAALGEVFEFDGIGTVRRHLFSVTRSFIKAFLSASHFRKLERQVLSLTEPKKIAAGVRSFREYMFPDDPSAVVTPPAELSDDEMRALRGKCLEALLASFPSRLVSLMGDSACENAALKMHNFLQHEVFVKNLLFSLADELLLHLFPDATVYKFRKPSAASAAVSSVKGTHSAPASPTLRATPPSFDLPKP